MFCIYHFQYFIYYNRGALVKSNSLLVFSFNDSVYLEYVSENILVNKVYPILWIITICHIIYAKKKINKFFSIAFGFAVENGDAVLVICHGSVYNGCGGDNDRQNWGVV